MNLNNSNKKNQFFFSLNSNQILFYFRNFVDDDDVGPIRVPLAPPTAIVNGVAFSCVISCRRLYSFNLSVVNCDVPFVDGDLFSASILTLSTHWSFKSGFADVILPSLDDVDDDDDGGLASENDSKNFYKTNLSFLYLQVK